MTSGIAPSQVFITFPTLLNTGHVLLSFKNVYYIILKLQLFNENK